MISWAASKELCPAGQEWDSPPLLHSCNNPPEALSPSLATWQRKKDVIMLEQIQRRAMKMIKASLFQGQDERAGVAQPGKDKTLGTPCNTFQCLRVSCKNATEGLFTKKHVVIGQQVMALN